jgi:hypothetical protein
VKEEAKDAKVEDLTFVKGVYTPFRRDVEIKQEFSSSSFFRAILTNDGIAYIFPSSKSLESMQDAKHPEY